VTRQETPADALFKQQTTTEQTLFALLSVQACLTPRSFVGDERVLSAIPALQLVRAYK
jgi:hypothetical protein